MSAKPNLLPTSSTDSGSPTPRTRREFCAQACKAASFVAMGTIAACGGSPSSPSAPTAPAIPATVTGRVVSIALDTATALSAVGSAGIAQTSLGSFLVAHTGQATYTALNATCTHEGCLVNGFEGGRYVCPCHGSQFATSGAVVMGPAARALPQYPTQVSGTTLTFTV